MCIYKYIFHTWYSQYSIFAQIWFCFLLFLVVLMQIFLFPSLILCLVTFDCEYMFFRALLKGLFETMHLNKDCVFGSTSNLGTFKMNYCVLGLREAMIVVKPSGILFVHRPALKSLLRWDLRLHPLSVSGSVQEAGSELQVLAYGQEVNPCLNALLPLDTYFSMDFFSL